MELCDLYAACRLELLGLGPSLSSDQLNASLVATPPWTVLDGYRHLTGVCADFLDGVMQGAGSPEWTAVQVTSRQTMGVAEVCDEWTARGPVLDKQMADAGPTMGFLAFDVWTHEQDIRAAIGSRGIRHDNRVTSLAALAVNMFAGRYAASGAPALLILLDGEPHQLGALGADPEVTLGTSAYELLRIIFGRRSAAQISRANWTGDFASVINALHVFDLPPIDIID
jgi:uncharacterized protein (TIGR03083 family)